MPDTSWTCSACREFNPPYTEVCRNCSIPATHKMQSGAMTLPPSADAMQSDMILPSENMSALPGPLRLIFFVIGLLMLILCFKSGGLLSTESTLKEVMGFAGLLAATVMSLSFALPPKYLMVAGVALSLIFPSMLLGGYLWKFGGLWRWGIPVLALGVLWLIVYALRKRQKRTQAHENNVADVFDQADFGGSDGGGGGGGGGD